MIQVAIRCPVFAPESLPKYDYEYESTASNKVAKLLQFMHASNGEKRLSAQIKQINPHQNPAFKISEQKMPSIYATSNNKEKDGYGYGALHQCYSASFVL